MSGPCWVLPAERGSVSEPVSAPPLFVGTVEIAVGACSLKRSGAAVVQIKSGDHVCEGDVIDTAEDSRICIRLIDGTIFSLSSNASAVLNRFALDVSAPFATLHVSRGNFSFVAGAIAKAGRFKIETPVASIRSRLLPSGLGLLSFTAFFLTTMDEIHAAGSGIAFLDDGTITYKDLEHGIFELVTKELNPRHIFVDDPGETIVLRLIGSSISESHVANSFAQMAQFEAAQQEALRIFSLGLQGPTATGTGGSSTPPSFQFPTFVQPINFTQPDNSSQHFTILDNVGAGGHSPPPQDLFLLPPPPPAPPGSVVEIPNATGQTTEDSTTGTLALGGESFSQSAPTFVWSAGALNEGQQTTLTHASTLTITPSGIGTANVNFSAPDDTFDFLAAGETLTITYEVTGIGANGATVTQPVTITIVGTNDAPKLDAEASGSHQFTELADTTGDATDAHTTSGTLQFTDPDLNDTHTVTSGSIASIDWLPNRQLPEGLENELLQAFSATAHDNAGTGTGSVDFTFSAPDRDFDFLAEGETLKVTYDVTVTDNHGVSSTQPVTVTVYGSEDKPVILSGNQSGSIFEDADNDQNENNESHVASGTIQFRDVDLTDAETSSITDKTLSAHLANGYDLTEDQRDALLCAFTIGDATHSAVDGTGTVAWQYNIDDKALDFLGADDYVTLTYTVQVSDGHGGYATQDVVVTVHGAEDAPVIVSGTLQSASVIEDEDNSIGENSETHHQSGTITFNDVDLSDQEAASFVAPPLVSATLASGDTLTSDQQIALEKAFHLEAATHSQADGSGTVEWHYDIADEDIDFLGAHDQVTLTYTVKVNDGHGGVASQQVFITVQGTEDLPVITEATSGSFSEDSGTNVQDLHEASGTISFTDADLSDRPTVTAAFDSFSYTDAYGTEITQLSDAQRDAIEALETHLQPLVPQDGNTNNGSAAWTYSVADSALDFLAQGETLTLKYTATVDDHQTGGTVTTPFALTITGTNDTPTIAVTDDSIWEQSGTNNSGEDIASGQITFADVDLTDRPTVTATFTDYTDSGDRILTVGQKAALETMLALGPTPDANDGSLAWTYTVPDKALDFLAQDETLTLTYTAKVDDSNGGTASQPLTVTIHGTNDAPVLQLTGAYILDQFNTEDYGAWVEQHDDFRAQNGSPTEGDFQIAHDPETPDGDLQIRLTDLDAEVGQPDLLSRTFDLSEVTSATLTFDYRRDIPNGDVDDKFFVFVSKDGGPPVQVDQIGATGNGSFVDEGYQHATISLAGFLSSGTTITFSVGDDVDNGDVVYVDNVKIAYDTAPTNNLVVNYTENSAVGVSGHITDVDGDAITSATFTLVDHQNDDVLSVVADLPNGIQTSGYNADTGTLTLTGQASLADYQAALQQVVFSNTSDNPDTADRHLTITVNDGFDDSEVTTTTIHVTPIDDAPIATDDNIITNASFTNFQIPVSALLANDSDPDNSLDQLSITHIHDNDDSASLSSGLVIFSHFDDGSFDYMVSDPDSLTDTGHVTVTKQSGNTLNGTSASEILIGNSSANTLNGGGGADILIGNGGDDTFVFKAVTDSQPGAGHFDTIMDFAADHDHVDLTAIAGATHIEELPGQPSTVAAGSVSWFIDNAHGQTIVYVNTTGAAETPDSANMEIHLVGTNIDLSNAFLLHHS